jgi:hypothetical protein
LPDADGAGDLGCASFAPAFAAIAANHHQFGGPARDGGKEAGFKAAM